MTNWDRDLVTQKTVPMITASTSSDSRGRRRSSTRPMISGAQSRITPAASLGCVNIPCAR